MNITKILASRENDREQNYTAGILVITAQLSEREREKILMKNKRYKINKLNILTQKGGKRQNLGI